MEDKILDIRLQQKYDTEEAWQEIENTFTPLAGEVIIYNDKNNLQQPKIKVGDGTHLLKDLIFVNTESEAGSIITKKFTSESTTPFIIDHNFNTRDVVVQIYDENYNDVMANIHRDLNSVTITNFSATYPLEEGHYIIAAVFTPGGTQGPQGNPGEGDMDTLTYDKNRIGIVDDSQKLGGKLPSEYQDKLISGINIKTFNGETILGTGDVPIPDPLPPVEGPQDEGKILKIINGIWDKGSILNAEDKQF